MPRLLLSSRQLCGRVLALLEVSDTMSTDLKKPMVETVSVHGSPPNGCPCPFKAGDQSPCPSPAWRHGSEDLCHLRPQAATAHYFAVIV
jgi:hypothetical protein